MIKRNKPKFFRQGWDRYIRLGRTVKKRRKWRRANGGDSKMRLKERGKAAKPTVGWGSDKKIRGMIKGVSPTRVENLTELANVPKGNGVIIGHVGKKNKMELIKKANEMGLKILNRYRS